MRKPNTELGTILRQSREDASITRRHMVHSLGVAYGETTIERMEAGTRRVSPEEVRQWLYETSAPESVRAAAMAALLDFASWDDAVKWVAGGER